MNIPGFTAEVALYRKSGYHLNAEVPKAGKRGLAVAPQLCSQEHTVIAPDPYCGCYGWVGCEEGGVSYTIGQYDIPGCYCV